MEQATINRSPLEQTHRRAGAKMKEQGGWLVPASYGDALEEYKVVRGGGAGLIDLSSRARIEIGGTEAAMFLNGLITNDVKTLKEESWMAAAFPNVQGRILALARVLRRKDRFLFDTEAVTRAPVVKTLSRFTLAGDFRVTDVTVETALLSLQGARASQIVRAVLGEDAAGVERSAIVNVNRDGADFCIIRATHTAEDGFDIFMSAGVAASLWDALLEAGARPVGFDALETLRIEAGQPRYNVDMDETKVLLETGQDDAVSFTKGCYIGQEIIARIHFRGHVAKRLAGLIMEGEGDLHPGDKIRTPEGREIGLLTSATHSPALGRSIALGYVKYDYLGPGTPVRIIGDGVERDARVAELPFVRGSWYGEA